MINQIESKLKNEGYDSRNAGIVASELMKVESSLQSLVYKWLSGKEDDFETQGFSIFGLMHSRKMTYPAALLTIDWLLKEPEKAKQSITKGIK